MKFTVKMAQDGFTSYSSFVLDFENGTLLFPRNPHPHHNDVKGTKWVMSYKEYERIKKELNNPAFACTGRSVMV